MLNRHLTNLTPHDINVRMANEDAFFTIAPTGVVARCDTEYNTVEQITAGGDVFNLRERYFNEPRNLPAPQENTLFIVSRIVAEAMVNKRDDLIFVDTTIKEDNRIIGCEAFARWPVDWKSYRRGFVTVTASLEGEFWNEVKNGDASINDVEWEVEGDEE